MKQLLSNYFKGDLVIWLVVGILYIFSLLGVYSATGTLAYKYAEGNTTYYFLRHAAFLLVGFGLMYLTHKVPYTYFSKMAHLLFLISIPLLVLTLLVGITRNEAARWLTIPGIGLDFQTSDLAKFALLMYIARMLSQSQDSKEQLRNVFKPILTCACLICGLILPANFSTAALLFSTCLVLMFVGRIPFILLLKTVGVLIVLLVAFVVLVFAMPNVGRFGTWKNRIQNFTTSSDSKGVNAMGNYQVEQAKIAVVTGGWFGKGPGNSTQRNFLPHPYSDFIFAIILEEYGLFGGLIVLALYLYLLFRTGVIIRRCQRTFPAFLAIGLTLSLVFQAITNMAVAVGVLPVTGQTLPFISMGGTSIIFTSIAFGLIISVSRSIDEQELETASNDSKIK